MRVLIVDDEPLAREGVAMLLADHADIDVVGECVNGAQAIRSIFSMQPDLVFLDVKMPRVGGFDVIESVGADAMPLVIFLTAYDEHAIAAFEVRALDYLLKPVDTERFEAALNRARQALRERDVADRAARLRELLDDSPTARTVNPDERIVIRTAGHVHFLRPSEILWVEASGDYVTLHTIDREHLLRDTMLRMEQRLLPHRFLRIHRSTIVNLNRIAELVANDHGDYTVVLDNRTELRLSRSYRDELYEALNA